MNRVRALPIQLRITLGSLVVAGIVLAAIAALMAHQIRATTSASEATLARSDIAPYVADLVNHPSEAPDRPSPGVLVAIRSDSGKFLLNSLPTELQKNLNDRDLHSETFSRVPPGEQNSEAPTKRVTSGGTTYVVVERHILAGGREFTLWGARSATSGDLTIMALDRSLIIGMIGALAAFGAAAWILSRLSLRPVRRLVESALRIGDSDSGEELPVSAAGDELSTLASTLNSFIARLRASAEHERQIVSDASHELRTPIAALTARLELAHRSFGDASALEKEILAAQASAGRLSELTTTLLELSRLDQPITPSTSGAQAPALVLVQELLDAVDRIRITPTGAAIQIEFDIDRITAPTAGYALTRGEFGRIADNLLTNAATFSPAGGTVMATMSQDNAGALTLAVTDEGPGVPPEFLSTAFDRFSRADESRRRIQGGTGLGLALVRKLVERAGGTASLVNRADKGARASVQVPQM